AIVVPNTAHMTTTLSNTADLTLGLRNQFLIAMPGMHDSSFAHTVTYVCEHSEKGAMGIVINNATPLFLNDIFVQMELTAQKDTLGQQPVYAGGPVQIERGFVLHPRGEWQSTLNISDEITLTAVRSNIEANTNEQSSNKFLIC